MNQGVLIGEAYLNANNVFILVDRTCTNKTKKLTVNLVLSLCIVLWDLNLRRSHNKVETDCWTLISFTIKNKNEINVLTFKFLLISILMVIVMTWYNLPLLVFITYL